MKKVAITTKLIPELTKRDAKEISNFRDIMLEFLKMIGADGMMTRSTTYDSYGRKMRHCECTLKNFCWRTDGIMDCIPYKLIENRKVPIKWELSLIK